MTTAPEIPATTCLLAPAGLARALAAVRFAISSSPPVLGGCCWSSRPTC